MDLKAYQIASKALGCYSLFLVVTGTIANLLCFGVCLRKRLRQIPTFIFLSFSAIMDMLVLYSYTLHQFYDAFNNDASIESTDIVWCYLSSFIQAFGQYGSSWISVLMTIEVFLSISLKHWRKLIFNSTKAAIVCTITIIAAFASTFYVVFASSFKIAASVSSKNTTIMVSTCSLNYLFTLQKQIELYAYALVPFSIILMMNSILIYKLHKRSEKTGSKKSASNDKKRLLSITILGKTFAFLLMSLPGEIAAGYFFKTLFSTLNGNIAYKCLRLLDFTYHGLNALALMAFNKQIYKEVKSIFFRNYHLTTNTKQTNKTLTSF